jgi:large subunit ribosomal protein L19
MKAKKFTKETILSYGTQDRKFPALAIGDVVIVEQKIKEGDKERLQAFEGAIIAMNNNGVASTITVRKIGANAVAIEKIFPYYSPRIASIKIVRSGRVRRAKLYYLRGRVGRAAHVERKKLLGAAAEAHQVQ